MTARSLRSGKQFSKYNLDVYELPVDAADIIDRLGLEKLERWERCEWDADDVGSDDSENESVGPESEDEATPPVTFGQASEPSTSQLPPPPTTNPLRDHTPPPRTQVLHDQKKAELRAKIASKKSARRNRNRARTRAATGQTRQDHAQHRHRAKVDFITVKDFDATTLPVNSSGWAGKKSFDNSPPKTFDEAMSFGLHLVKANVNDRIPPPRAASKGDPAPFDEEVTPHITKVLSELGGNLKVKSKNPVHLRGQFLPMADGPSYGGGQQRPCNKCHSKHNQQILDNISNNRHFRRAAGHLDTVFRTVMDDMAEEYQKMNDALHANDPSLKTIFGNSIFASVTYNCGPRTCCQIHGDHKNKACGYCVITAYGDFDHTKGGHFIAWDLGLIFELPPGWSIFVPSALVRHSNTQIAPHERRYSMTRYTASGLFRWVYNDFKSDKEFEATATREQKTKREEDRKTRWKREVDLFIPSYLKKVDGEESDLTEMSSDDE